VKKAGDMNFLVFDQFLFETAFDFSIVEEVMFANFKYLTVSKAGEPADREKPVFDSIDFSSEDYDDFWSYIEIKNGKWLNYFNTQVFGNGVPLPYWNLQFLTDLTFQPRAMIIVLDLYYNLLKE
jgi:hypothetical protein